MRKRIPSTNSWLGTVFCRFMKLLTRMNKTTNISSSSGDCRKKWWPSIRKAWTRYLLRMDWMSRVVLGSRVMAYFQAPQRRSNSVVFWVSKMRLMVVILYVQRLSALSCAYSSDAVRHGSRLAYRYRLARIPVTSLSFRVMQDSKHRKVLPVCGLVQHRDHENIAPASPN